MKIQLWAFGSLADEGEIWGLITDFNGHGGFEVVRGGGLAINQEFQRCHTNFLNLANTSDAAAASRN